MKRRISPATAVLSASAVTGVIAGAAVWRSAGPAASLCLMVAVMFVGATLVVVARWAQDQIHRRSRGRRAAEEQRAAAPLPRRWEVPDYPPEDLRPPAS